MKTRDAILAELNEVFAPMDAEVLAASQEWAKGRVKAVRDYKTSDEARALARRDQHRYYSHVFSLAGGKTWYNVFNGRNATMIEEFMVKNCAATVALRNAKIARKLEAAGVTEVISQNYTYSPQGFDGVFIVNTDAGQKRVTINTIRAGGYNIQCLHLRVLVKVS